jgi:hypothetical protein
LKIGHNDDKSRCAADDGDDDDRQAAGMCATLHFWALLSQFQPVPEPVHAATLFI